MRIEADMTNTFMTETADFTTEERAVPFNKKQYIFGELIGRLLFEMIDFSEDGPKDLGEIRGFLKDYCYRIYEAAAGAYEAVEEDIREIEEMIRKSKEGG